MKILLLGHNGFVGRYIYARLSGSHELFTSSRSNGDFILNLTEQSQYSRVFDGFTFDIVVCAAVSYDTELSNALDNVRIAVNVMQYFQENVKQIVFISSISAIGENKNLNVYNFSKYLEEEAIRFCNLDRNNVTVLRFCQIVDIDGGSRNAQKGFHYIADCIKSNSDLRVYTLNDAPRSYISINDVCRIVSYSIDKHIYGFHNIVLKPTLTLRQLTKLFLNSCPDYSANVSYVEKEALHYNIPDSSKYFDDIISDCDIVDYLLSFVIKK